MIPETTQKKNSNGWTNDNSIKMKSVQSWIPGIFGSGFCLIFLCIILVIPILQLVFGLVFQNQCPIKNQIPLYLIVSGACGIANILMIFICQMKYNK
jgi:hypothetical protein